MSSTRRRNARTRRALAQSASNEQRLRLMAVRNGPAVIRRYGNREALIFDGVETTTRNRFGEVVVSYKAPDFMLDRPTYGALLSARPAPLTSRQRAKLAR